MPLSSAQERAAVVLLSSTEGRVNLAGGAALIAQGVTDRTTTDLDGFTSASGTELEATFSRVRSAFARAGYTITERDGRPSETVHTIYVRPPRTSDRGRPPEEIKIQIVGDEPALEAPANTPLGPMLTIDELGANKILAVQGRTQPRDLDDIAHLVRAVPFSRMLHVADRKETHPLDRRMLAQTFAAFRDLSDVDFPDPSKAPALRAWALEVARELVEGNQVTARSPYEPGKQQAAADLNQRPSTGLGQAARRAANGPSRRPRDSF